MKSPGNGTIEQTRADRIARATKGAVIVDLPKIDVRSFSVTLNGLSPLIVHKFSEKSRKEIEDKQQKKAKGAKEVRVPRNEYLASFYMLEGTTPETPDAVYGVPASAFKNAAVDACTFVDGMTKVEARGAFHVIADEGPLVKITDHSAPTMREDTVRIGMGTLDLRYRPEFAEWSVTLGIRYNHAAISPDQIVNLFNLAGFSIGIGEWRPQRDGMNGMFEVKRT